MNSQTVTEEDISHLQRAIELAKNGLGRTSPNPVVGAVVVKDGGVVGGGWHDSYGGDHAEIAAVKACDGNTAGATMYVTLEPCCHEGKTPPCTDAIIEAGVGRVVVASDDPTDKASGRGLGILRDEGISVVSCDGDIARQARLLNQPFRKLSRTGRPWVLFKSAVTLDGKVATQTGDSKWISSNESRELVHRWRAQADAVCTGIGTVESDDPLLTARDVLDVFSQPARIVFDSEARLSLDSQIMSTVDRAPVFVVASRGASRSKIERLESKGAAVIVASGQNESERVHNALLLLGAEGIQSILLEGGPRIAGAFLDAEEIDAMRIFVAPIAVGGRDAPVMMQGDGSKTIDDGQRALSMDTETVGGDVLIRTLMREW